MKRSAVLGFSKLPVIDSSERERAGAKMNLGLLKMLDYSTDGIMEICILLMVGRKGGLLFHSRSTNVASNDLISNVFGGVGVRSYSMVVLVDDENRENEGDIIMAASKVTTEAMAFIVKHWTGIVCASMKEEDMQRLHLPLMVTQKENEEKLSTAFTISMGDIGDGLDILVRVRSEWKGNWIDHKLHAYKLQDAGHDMVEASEKLGLPVDSREYGIVYR
ncbi:probable bifunctional riboflavin biosynthesis RIBA 1, chloroplastic [Olea europaea subsp. europaea]|uniref:Probable bifunctional riboflavin biosynthesis RIBA 1, chloroplastic n=1 Tax=Olea europaea subsp. europaea TaxID=158383 RepID=A0A8S0RK05_OLEEU|nr:probable bifunctional riboflavin biosynthesis RIBA 1, chloroplastic [Olea europaea subsp. europaea]